MEGGTDKGAQQYLPIATSLGDAKESLSIKGATGKI